MGAVILATLALTIVNFVSAITSEFTTGLFALSVDPWSNDIVDELRRTEDSEEGEGAQNPMYDNIYLRFEAEDPANGYGPVQGYWGPLGVPSAEWDIRVLDGIYSSAYNEMWCMIRPQRQDQFKDYYFHLTPKRHEHYDYVVIFEGEMSLETPWDGWDPIATVSLETS
jgi:hypothetical protein